MKTVCTILAVIGIVLTISSIFYLMFSGLTENIELLPGDKYREAQTKWSVEIIDGRRYHVRKGFFIDTVIPDK